LLSVLFPEEVLIRLLTKEVDSVIITVEQWFNYT